MRDEIPARLQNAWWVHPHTGEVIPVHAHAKSVADNPAKFGLKASDIGDVGGGQRMNYFDRKAGSAAQDAITAANKQGWVRVRNVLGRGPMFQVHGNAHEIPAVIGHLEKKGIKLRGPATVDDPGHGYTKTFSGGVEAVKTANLGNVAKAGSGDAEVWHNMDDESARDLLRTRLLARAGLPQEERALLLRRIAAFLTESASGPVFGHPLHPSGAASSSGDAGAMFDAEDEADWPWERGDLPIAKLDHVATSAEMHQQPERMTPIRQWVAGEHGGDVAAALRQSPLILKKHRSGSLDLVDGHHRLALARAAGLPSVHAIIAHEPE